MERSVRNAILPGAALAHLSLFLVLGIAGVRDAVRESWAAFGIAPLAIILVRDFSRSGRTNRYPDAAAILAWAGAVALEIHVLSPSVAQSRVVPAVLFPAGAYLLGTLQAAAFSSISLAWLAWTTWTGSESAGTVVGICILAVLGHAAGTAVRSRRPKSSEGPEILRSALEEGMSYVAPRRREDDRHDSLLKDSAEHLRLLQSGEWIRGSIRRVLEGLLTVTGAAVVCFVSRSRGQEGGFRIRAAAAVTGRTAPERIPIPGDYPPVRGTFEKKKPFLSEDARRDAFVSELFGKGKAPFAVGTVPVFVEESVEGVVLAYKDDEGPWGEAVVHWLETGAYFIANEIGREREWFQMARYVEEHVGFLRYAKRILSIPGENPEARDGPCARRKAVYRATAEGIRQLLGAGRVLLLETGGAAGRASVAWETSNEGSMPREEEYPLEGTYVEWVAGKGVHRIFSGAGPAEQRHPVLPAGLDVKGEVNFLLFPLSGMEGFSGVLVCASGPGRSFDGIDVDTVHAALDLMRVGISEAMREESLREGATTDGLTGLLNQRTFRARLGSVIERLDGRHPCAVLMLDIDHFKRINDTYGHPGGDEVLRAVSGVIRKTVRKGDFAGRYGGEEFAVFLHMSDTRQALQAAERLRTIIRKTAVVLGGKTVSVTVSLGVACCPAHGRTPGDLVACADAALYRSKREGRDRVTMFERVD